MVTHPGIEPEFPASDKDFLNEFGYHSKKLAESVLVRQLKHLPEKDRYWDDEYKIIEIDI